VSRVVVGQIRATLTALAAVWFQVRASTCLYKPAPEEVVQALLELQRAQDGARQAGPGLGSVNGMGDDGRGAASRDRTPLL